jgi:hypothetical protein
MFVRNISYSTPNIEVIVERPSIVSFSADMCPCTSFSLNGKDCYSLKVKETVLQLHLDVRCKCRVEMVG